MSIALIDLTRAWPNTEQYVLSKVLEREPADASLEIVVTPEQAAALDAVFASRQALIHEVLGSELDLARRITEIVTERLNTSDAVVRVYTFWPAVRGMALYQDSLHPGRVHYMALAPYAPPNVVTKPNLVWDNSLMTEGEAVQALVTVLSSAGASGLAKTSVRPQLERLDARFAKRADSITSKNGFISLVVDMARRRGLVEEIGTEPALIVRLASAGGGSHPALAPAGPATAPSSAPPLAADAPTTLAPSGRPEPVTSSLLVDRLRAAQFGPFMDIRWTVYEEMDRLAAAGNTPLWRFVKEAVGNVRRASEESNGKPMPWSRVVLFIEDLLTKRAVAIAGGEPQLLSWTAGSLLVEGFINNWRLWLDAEIILFLIDADIDLTLHDCEHIAGTLYASRAPAAEQRVFDIVGLLKGGGEIEYEGVAIRRSAAAA